MKKSQCKEASLDWKDKSIPISKDFNDPYFSIEDGMAESEYVFINGNNLKNRLINNLKIAELGFGIGLNLLTLVKVCNESQHSGKIIFTSFEAYPVNPQDIRRALISFPFSTDLTDQLLIALEANLTNFDIENVSVRLIYGDARNTILDWQDKVDAWFLDGFSPKKNPELWELSLLTSVHKRTITGGTFSTYTAAGDVRRNLSKVGFKVTKSAGFGQKRHMLLGEKID